jgi:anthranilate/para-aminobenzoate synthase component I
MSSVKEELLPRTWLYDKNNGLITLESPTSAYLYYSTQRLDLLTGKESKFSFSKYCEKICKENLIDNHDTFRVFHFFYESAEFFQTNPSSFTDFKGPLAVEIHYNRSRPYAFSERDWASDEICVEQKSPDYKDYQEGFKRIQNHLINGDAYQVNYT